MDVVKVWENTRIKCHDLVCLGETIVCRFDPTFDIDRIHDTTIVSVVNKDTLDVALKYPNSLLLNMANPQIPGGYLQTVGAQEEDLFRCTDLCNYLDKSHYPLPNMTALLSTKVRVFSFGLRQRYKLLSQEKQVDIITCAAVKNEILGKKITPKNAFIMKTKIELLYQTAILYKYSTLVLSAFGCGGFGCPPEHVSQLFKHVTDKYQGCIKNVIFAIFDDNHPHSNYDVFRKCFS